MKLPINSMNSISCIDKVEKVLRKLKLKFNFVDLRGIDLKKELTSFEYNNLNAALKKWDMSITNLKYDKQIADTCIVIFNMFGVGKVKPKSYSVYIGNAMKCNYRNLERKFVKIMNISIKRYITEIKMLKAKEYINKGILPLKEIAIILHYCDVYHFSHQFIKETKQSPGHYLN